MPTRVDSGPLASELRVVLGHLVRRLRAEHRLPLSQGLVLARLDREGPQGTSDLATAERIRPQSMGQTVADLEAQGFIERHADASDRRRTLLELTDAGRAALFADRDRREGWLAEALESSLSNEERRTVEQAVSLLDRIADR
ncbi:MAG: MarR family winged helix-turn-helix transcriptional regulator [Solirubrobacterales bacterium]